MVRTFKKIRSRIKNYALKNALIFCQIFALVFSFINRVDTAYSFVWTVYFILPIMAFLMEKEYNKSNYQQISSE